MRMAAALAAWFREGQAWQGRTVCHLASMTRVLLPVPERRAPMATICARLGKSLQSFVTDNAQGGHQLRTSAKRHVALSARACCIMHRNETRSNPRPTAVFDRI